VTGSGPAPSGIPSGPVVGGPAVGDRTVADYLARLAARSSDPAGGVCAALGVAQAAALVAMVGRLSDRDPAELDRIAEVVARADAVRSRALDLAGADAAAVAAVMAAYRLPRGTDRERASRADAVRSALLAAARPQAEVVRAATDVVGLAARLLPVARAAAVPDLVAGVQAARGAVVIASFNVEADLTGDVRPEADLVRRAGTESVDDVLRQADELTAAARRAVLS
jgi:formiminotetrahydrofolate cyclodeaminase